jgi:putative oxidoreductase
MKQLAKCSDSTYALLRIVAGLMFSFHGMQKLFGVMSDMPSPEIGTQMWIGGVIELVGGLLVATGLMTRFAAFITSGMMAVAYFQFHLLGGTGTLPTALGGFLPTINKGELAVLYCFVFLYIACRGGVKWCIDKTS